ncbi:MAG: hypothetical protein QM703_26135 [Gemmatales bacterium]
MDHSFQFFEPSDALTIIEHRLPHWSQAGTICFITWRTYDSLPASVLQSWHDERRRWLLQQGVQLDTYPECLQQLSPHMRKEYHTLFSGRWHQHLDDGHGSCELQRPEVAKIVADSLLHFDGSRYLLTDFVVMPNHVHVLASFVDEASLLNQCESWKHFTATQINRFLGRKGRFWQQDGFDHLVRSEEQFQFLRKYLYDNPVRAKLRQNQFVHYSKVLS